MVAAGAGWVGYILYIIYLKNIFRKFNFYHKQAVFGYMGLSGNRGTPFYYRHSWSVMDMKVNNGARSLRFIEKK